MNEPACLLASVHDPGCLLAWVQVATPRVRTATKKDIPHQEDDVSKINAVGHATQVSMHMRHVASCTATRPR